MNRFSVILVLLVLVLFYCMFCSNESSTQTYKVLQLVGHNKFKLEGEEIVQLAGIPNNPESATFLRKQIEKGENVFQFDSHTSPSGERLVYVYNKQGQCLNSEMIRKGILIPDISYDYDSSSIYNPRRETPTVTTVVQPPTTESPQANRSLSDLFVALKQSIVVIYAGDSSDGSSHLGTGFFIDSTGVLISNHHVFNSNLNGYVELVNGQRFRITQTIKENQALDFVVFRIENTNNTRFPTVQLVNSDSKIGENIFVIGHPQGMKYTMTKGIITNINQGSRPEDIMTDAAVNHGNSGGPMFNMRGNVIGLVTYKRGEGCELCGFALDIRKIDLN